MLDVDGLVRRFGDMVALDGLSFSVPVGEVTGFLGPNGAGKSTTMRAILRLTELDAGEVRWQGQPYGRETCATFGYLPEERGLYSGMRVGEHLAYLARLHGLTARDATGAAARWCERLGVNARLADKVGELSLGNQQRVQLAAALVHEPQLLVLDEPFSGLDPAGVDQLAAVLAELASEGRAVLFSSHQLDLVENLCQRVVIVNAGRLVASGLVRDLSLVSSRRLVVEVSGDREAVWAASLPGVTVSECQAGMARLVLAEGLTSDDVLDAARRAGTVTHFAFDRRRLSEVFREAVAPSGVDSAVSEVTSA